MISRRLAPVPWAAGGVIFLLLLTANGGGYRYGASDAAFHVPAAFRLLHPGAFPRDAALIDAQGTLMVFDDAVAALVRATGASLEAVFLAGYVLSVALVWTAVVLIGRRLPGGPWVTVAIGAALTLRHRIPRTSANSFEPYFYPRTLAFGLGMLAIAALLHRRAATAIVLVGGAAIVHITTGAWFAVLLGVAMLVLDRRMRRFAAAGAIVAGLAGAWVLGHGLLPSAFTVMDPAWLEAVASKDSLFPSDWPAWAWIANLGLAVVLGIVHRMRTAAGTATREDRALVFGAFALIAVFLLTLPAVAMRWALPTQLQISRVFWLVDLVATIYLVALLIERASRWRPRAASVAASALVLLSAVRGGYLMLVEFEERPLFQVHLPESPWQEAMDWIAAQPRDVHVLADPGHAWKYGTSVRVSAGRDVLLEDTKDSALAIYSRDVAVRVTERTGAIGDFPTISAGRAQDLARKYDLDYLVTEAALPLPLVHRNRQFSIYDLR